MTQFNLLGKTIYANKVLLVKRDTNPDRVFVVNEDELVGESRLVNVPTSFHENSFEKAIEYLKTSWCAEYVFECPNIIWSKWLVSQMDSEKIREHLFVEDDNENRYREVIFCQIEAIGVENWFKARGFPINPDSVWKNRYTGDTTTLIEEVNQNGVERGLDFVGIESQGLYLWENWLPIEQWTDRDMSDDYKKKEKGNPNNLLQFAENSNPKPKGMINEFLERNEHKID